MSKRKSSELVRDAGMPASVWQKFEEAVERHHGLTEDLDLLARPGGDPIIDTMAKQLVMVGALRRNAYVVPVNYGLAHAQQIEEAKFDLVTNYDRKLIRKNPTEHLYPLPTGQIEQRIILVHLNRYAKRPEIIAEMDTLNVRPVLSPELLALTKAYPDLQRKFWLVGLGSVWVVSRGRRYVLSACGDSDERRLDLGLGDDGWDGGCRFPAVCESWFLDPLDP